MFVKMFSSLFYKENGMAKIMKSKTSKERQKMICFQKDKITTTPFINKETNKIITWPLESNQITKKVTENKQKSILATSNVKNEPHIPHLYQPHATFQEKVKVIKNEIRAT